MTTRLEVYNNFKGKICDCTFMGCSHGIQGIIIVTKSAPLNIQERMVQK